MSGGWAGAALLTALAGGVFAAPVVFDWSVPKYHQDFDDVTAMEAYRHQVIAALEDGRFGELEAEAVRCRKESATFPNGDERYMHFIRSPQSLGYLIPYAPFDPFIRVEEQSKNWVRKSPRSIHAWLMRRQASARRFEFKYALAFAAGSEVSAAAKAQKEESLKACIDATIKAWALDGGRDPYVLYSAWETTLMDQPGGLPSREVLVDMMEKRLDHPQIRRAWAWEKIVQSGAGPQEFAEATGRLEREFGPEAVFEAAAWIGMRNRTTVIADHPWDFEVIRKGYEAMIAKSPSLSTVGRMAFLSSLAERSDLTGDLYGRLGQHYEWDYFADLSRQSKSYKLLRMAGIGDPEKHTARYIASRQGKDPELLEEWNARNAAIIQDAVEAIGGGKSEMAAFFKSLPDRSSGSKGSLLTALNNLWDTPKDQGSELKSAIRSRIKRPDKDAWVDYLVQRARLSNGCSSDVVSLVAQRILKIAGSSSARMIYPLFKLSEARCLEHLGADFQRACTTDPEAANGFRQSVQKLTPNELDVFLKQAKQYLQDKANRPKKKVLIPAIKWVVAHGSKEQKKAAKALGRF